MDSASRERIFWVTCPQCETKYYVDYALRFRKDVALKCPCCQRSFAVSESPEIDDRWL
jgi:transposase-like protein